MLSISIAYFILSLAFGLNAKVSNSDLKVQEKWLVDQNSSMIVLGETNVNTFECALTSYIWSKNLVLYKSNSRGTKNYPVNCEFEIPVKSFDCGLQLMTSDLRKTLQSEKFPFMNIKLKAMSELISNARNDQYVVSETDIILAGVKKSSVIRFKVNKSNDQDVKLTATRVILLSDYNISPPTRFMGTVRVKDEMVIHITINLKRSAV